MVFWFQKLFCTTCTTVEFIYSEKATKFCEIFTLLLTVCTVVKSKVKISKNRVAFSEYMNFTMAETSNYKFVEILPSRYSWPVQCSGVPLTPISHLPQRFPAKKTTPLILMHSAVYVTVKDFGTKLSFLPVIKLKVS